MAETHIPALMYTHLYSAILPRSYTDTVKHSSRLYHKNTHAYIQPFKYTHCYSAAHCQKGPTCAHTRTQTRSRPLTCLWQPSTMMSFCWGEVRANTISVWFLSRSSRYSELMSFRSEPCTTQALASLGNTHTQTQLGVGAARDNYAKGRHWHFRSLHKFVFLPFLSLSPSHTLYHEGNIQFSCTLMS